MDQIHPFSPLLIVGIFFLFTDSGNNPLLSLYNENPINHHQNTFKRPYPPKETNILIDEKIAAYINSQAKLDNANQVVLIADSIALKENITLQKVDLILVANYFSTAGKKIEVLPLAPDQKQTGISGKKGKDVQIIAEKVDKAWFHLPGTDGKKGRDGKNGKNGKKSEVKQIGDVSMGTAGSDGKNGGKGGNGGTLTIHTLEKDYQVKLTAPGGKGGKGGNGGTGGTTYMKTEAGLGKPGNSEKPRDPGNDNGRVQPLRLGKSNVIGRKEKDGKNGKSGKGGIRGREIKKVVKARQFQTFVREHYHRDWKELNNTGWQIIFSKK